MLVGHAAAAFALKRVDPRASLGALALAAMCCDVLWAIFMLAGVEHVAFTSGRGAANYLILSDVGYSHSLLMTIVWAAIVAAVCAAIGRRQIAALLAVAVFSHWCLDVVSHPPDMPLAPGGTLRLGLGLWTSVPATIVVEGGMWASALAIYARAARARRWTSTLVLWIGAALLTLVWYNNIAGPPPPNPRTAPVGSLILFVLMIAWAEWADRGRSLLAQR